MRMLPLVHTTSNRRGRAYLLGLALALGLTVALAACSGGSSARTPTPGTTTNPGGTSASPSGGTPSASPQSTLTPAGTAPAEAGAGDICDQAASISASVPNNIPAYPGAKLQISYITTDNSGHTDGSFGYCAGGGASASTVASFYAQQLPSKGWGSIQQNTLGDHQQVAASKGGSQLTMTAWPDSGQSGVTDILITAQGI